MLENYQRTIRFNRLHSQLFQQLHLSAQQVAQLQALVQSGANGTAIHQLLGDEGFKAYQADPASSFDRGIADRLSAALVYTATPLTAEQRNQLVDLMDDPRDASGAAPNAENLMRSAASFLLPVQIEALQSVIVAENARQSVYSAIASPRKVPRS